MEQRDRLVEGLQDAGRDSEMQLKSYESKMHHMEQKIERVQQEKQQVRPLFIFCCFHNCLSTFVIFISIFIFSTRFHQPS